MSRSFDPTSPIATGWLVSCLLHGGLAIAAMLFMQRLQLAPQAEPFQWDVTMAAVSTSSLATVASRSSTPPTSERSTATADSRTRSGRPRIETAVPLSSSHTAPTHEQPSPATQASPDLLPQAPSLAAEPMDRPEHEPLPHPGATGSETPGPPTQPTQMELPTQPYPISDQPPSTLQHQSVSSAEDGITQPPSIASLPAVPGPADVGEPKPTRAQYGWLADLMVDWIEDLNKRYPPLLRTEGIQGKVTLTARLHDDGVLSDVRVIKSSGNRALDQVALEDVRNGPPIKLSRPLERPHMSVRFSISYDLKTGQ